MNQKSKNQPTKRSAARAAAAGQHGRSASAVVTVAARALGRLRPADEMTLDQQRRLLADLFRLMGDHVRRGGPAAPANPAVAEPVAATAATPPPPGDAPADAGNGVSPVPPDRRLPDEPAVPLSPRARQTLDRLLRGDSEKQVARHMGLSRHTVHIYVKTLYRKFRVCSRGELLAKFVRPANGHARAGIPAEPQNPREIT